MSRDRRSIDPILKEIKDQVAALDQRLTTHEQGEFERYDRMIDTARVAHELAQSNAGKLDKLIENTKEPLQLYNNGKTGLVIVQTSGRVVRWLAGIVGAAGVLWYVVTHLKLPGG